MMKLHTAEINGFKVLSLHQTLRQINEIRDNISRRVGMGDKDGKENDSWDWLPPQERAVKSYNAGFHMGMRKALELLSTQINAADCQPAYRTMAFVGRVKNSLESA